VSKMTAEECRELADSLDQRFPRGLNGVVRAQQGLYHTAETIESLTEQVVSMEKTITDLHDKIQWLQTAGVYASIWIDKLCYRIEDECGPQTCVVYAREAGRIAAGSDPTPHVVPVEETTDGERADTITLENLLRELGIETIEAANARETL